MPNVSPEPADYKGIKSYCMNIRNEIENLAIWFVVASLLVTTFGLIWTGFSENLVANGGLQTIDGFQFMAAIGTFGSIIDNVAVGLWVFLSSRKREYNSYLWFAFGFFGSLVGATLYLLAVFSEQILISQSSSQPEAGGAPQNGATN